MTDKTTLLLNANSAPAADAFLMLDQVTPNGERVAISECLQMKHGQATALVDEEFKKACDQGDILVLLRNTRDKAPTSKNGHIVFVSEEQFEAYFGLYAGRAFNGSCSFSLQ